MTDGILACNVQNDSVFMVYSTDRPPTPLLGPGMPSDDYYALTLYAVPIAGSPAISSTAARNTAGPLLSTSIV